MTLQLRSYKLYVNTLYILWVYRIQAILAIIQRYKVFNWQFCYFCIFLLLLFKFLYWACRHYPLKFEWFSAIKQLHQMHFKFQDATFISMTTNNVINILANIFGSSFTWQQVETSRPQLGWFGIGAKMRRVQVFRHPLTT